jgi:hypothetical protein
VHPRRIIGVIVAIGGFVLLVMGLRAADSVASWFSNMFTGNPTDRALWLTIGGIAVMLIGATIALLPVRAMRA